MAARQISRLFAARTPRLAGILDHRETNTTLVYFIYSYSGVARILKFCRPIAERASKVRAACARAPLAGPGACSPGEIFENCVFEIARNTLKLYNLAPCQC